MVFDLTEEQRMIQETAREFARKEVLPKAAELDENSRFPEELIRQMAELGFMGIAVPRSTAARDGQRLLRDRDGGDLARVRLHRRHHVGQQFPRVRPDPQVRLRGDQAGISRADGLREEARLLPGSRSPAPVPTQVPRRRPLSGTVISTSSTERRTSLRTPAGGHLRPLHNDRQGESHKGITAFVVDMKWKGVSLGKHEKKMGIKASATSSIVFEDVRVPAKNRLGNEGDGFKVALSTLDGGRIGIASQAIGIARASFEDALSYSKDRKQFGQAICDFQAIQWMLADIATEIDAARLLTWRAAWMKDRKMRHSKESSMAKLYASEVAMRAAVKVCRSTEGTGTSRSTRRSATSATRRSPRSTKVPPRSSGWSSRPALLKG